MRTSTTAPPSEAIVSAWIAAFNARDLDAMLRYLDPHVDLRPLRMIGLQRAYRGHDGVRSWFAQLRQHHHEHRIVIAEIQASSDGHVLTSGAVSIAGERDAAPFCAQHRLANGLIVAARHYMSDPDVLTHLSKHR